MDFGLVEMMIALPPFHLFHHWRELRTHLRPRGVRSVMPYSHSENASQVFRKLASDGLVHNSFLWGCSSPAAPLVLAVELKGQVVVR